MSVRRTPPKAVESPTVTVFQTPLQYVSDSNTSEQAEYESGASASVLIPKAKERKSRKAGAPKRTFADTNDESKSEVMDMLKKLSKNQEAKFAALLLSNTEIKTSLEFMAQKCEELNSRVQTVEKENKKLNDRVLFLEEQLEIQNRNARSTSIEIRSLPQNQKETKTDLKDLVVKTADFLNITLGNADIKDVYRINTKAAVKPIIADFTTVSARDNFITSYKKYNKEHRGAPLNSANIKVPGPSKPIYISENLTQKDRRLYYLAREFAAAHAYSFCWVSYGKIYLRKAEGAPAIRVACEGVIEKLRKK